MNTPFFAANWKMNKQVEEVVPFVEAFKPLISGIVADFFIAPPATHMERLKNALQGTQIQWGGQNCGPDKSGAYTAEISPLVLKELGCTWVILGHSERRHVFHEDETLLGKRLKAALDASLKVIYCIGETLEQRKTRKTFELLRQQLATLTSIHSEKELIIAYEPVWAIGTGENATPEQAEEAHQFIREELGKKFSFGKSIRILYGGSVKPDNAEALLKMPSIDGFLVGGASLEAKSFASIIQNGMKAKG